MRLEGKDYVVRDGDVLDMGPHRWRVVTGSGHSPEHACLLNEREGVLVSGDQVLPRISSNVSVNITEPDADPLGEWLLSLAVLKERVPQDVLVLPAHGRPFRGAHERLDELMTGHRSSLDLLVEFCRQPRRAIDTFPVLFKRDIDRNNLIMATGESIAHLNYLLSRGVLQVETDRHGVRWYCSA